MEPITSTLAAGTAVKTGAAATTTAATQSGWNSYLSSLMTPSNMANAAGKAYIGMNALDNMEQSDSAVISAVLAMPTTAVGSGKAAQDAGTQILRVPKADGSISDEIILTTKSGPKMTTTDAAGKKIEEQTTTYDTVETKYMKFGHLDDVWQSIREGHIPSARAVYLAVLDVVDAIDCGIMGDKITSARIKDNIKQHQLNQRATTINETEVGKGVEEDVSTKEKDIKKTTAVDKTKNTVMVEVLLDGNKVDVMTQTQESTTTRVTLQSSDKLSWKEKILGGKVESDVKQTTNTEISLSQQRYNPETKQMEAVGEKQTSTDSSVAHSKGDAEWKSGYFSYVPVVGSGTDLVRKHGAGFTLTAGDYISFGFDIATTAITFGAGAMAGKMAGKSAVLAGTKYVAKNAAYRLAPQTPILATRAAKLLGSNYQHLGKVFSPERIASKALTVAHNPMKASFLKSLLKLQALEKQGISVKNYLKTEFAAQGKMGALRAHNLEAQFRYAKKIGLLTPENQHLMMQGKNPIDMLGRRMDIDHIIPKSLAPELKAEPANLRFLPQLENIVRSNQLDSHAMARIRDFQKAMPEWQPQKQLLAALPKIDMMPPSVLHLPLPAVPLPRWRLPQRLAGVISPSTNVVGNSEGLKVY